jgi:hypothetical protein
MQPDDRTPPALGDPPAMPTASQQAVEPSYIEALATSAAEQPRDLRLELEQHLQRALRDFRLIGRVGGQELAALDQVIDLAGTWWR